MKNGEGTWFWETKSANEREIPIREGGKGCSDVEEPNFGDEEQPYVVAMKGRAMMRFESSNSLEVKNEIERRRKDNKLRGGCMKKGVARNF